MSVDANQLQKGQLIKFNNAIWKIINKDDITPGRRSAIVQLELKNISTGSKLYQRFVSDTKMDLVTSDSIKMQYLYKDSEMIYVMNLSDYEQESYNINLIDENVIGFLKEEMILNIEMADEKVFSILLPQNFTYEIVDTAPYIKGQTAKASFKNATLDCGEVIKVPEFLDNGTKIIVNIYEKTYLEKAK